MNEHPILFRAEMVRAILDGSKTQTRRVIKPQPLMMCSGAWYPSDNPGDSKNRTGLHYANEKHMRRGLPIDFSPYGQPGDRLWVRETYALEHWEDEPATPKDGRPIFHHAGDGTEWDEQRWFYPHYKATDPAPDLCYEDDENDDGEPKCKWSPSIHMPRWASRITLEIVNIRVERVQEITEEDAFEEGMTRRLAAEQGFSVSVSEEEFYISQARRTFHYFWNSLNAKRGFGWDVNPWAWVIEFKEARTPRKLEPQ